MKLWRRIQAAVLVVVLAVCSLGLAGCFSFGKEGTLTLPNATIAPPGIASAGSLRVGVDSSHAPFAGLSGDKVIGIDVDIAAALAEQMGLRLIIVDVKSQDVAALLREGTIDIAMGIQSDATTPFGEVQVGPYLLDGPAAFTVGLSDTPPLFDPAQLNGMRIVAQEGSLSAWQVGKSYGEESLVTYPSLNLVFDELSRGSVSYAAADAIVGSFLAVQYENIRCEGLLSDAQGIYLGVANDRQELSAALTEALRGLRDGGILQLVVSKWLGPVSTRTVMSEQAIVALGQTGELLSPDGQDGQDDQSTEPPDDQQEEQSTE
jgi:polar amino acid transport system substrate-binding protein